MSHTHPLSSPCPHTSPIRPPKSLEHILCEKRVVEQRERAEPRPTPPCYRYRSRLFCAHIGEEVREDEIDILKAMEVDEEGAIKYLTANSPEPLLLRSAQ